MMKRMSGLKKNKLNLFVFFQGRFISELGGGVFSFGSSLMILDITGKGLAFAISLVINTVPKIVFSYIAGMVSDKFDKKKLMVLCDLLSGVLMLIYYALLCNVSSTSVESIYLCIFLLSTISVFFSVSTTNAIPYLVNREEDISRLNGVNQTILSVSSVLGPAVGGFVYSYFDYKVFVLINAISFVLSGISEIFIKFNVCNQKKKIDKRKEKSEQSIRSFFKERKDILKLVLSCTGMNIFLIVGFSVPMPYIVNNVLEMNAYQYGILKTSLIIGSIIGSLKIIINSIDENLMECYKKNIIRIGLVYILFSFVSLINIETFMRLILLIFLFLSSSICIIRINIPLRTMLQKNIPETIRGRVLGVLNTILSIAGPLGNIVAGILIDRVEPYLLPLISGIALVMLALNIKVNMLIRCDEKMEREMNVLVEIQKNYIYDFLYNKRKRMD